MSNRVWYDTEFLENGRTIELISFGATRENDGAELYLINRDAPWSRIKNHPWLCENVVPHLPLVDGIHRAGRGRYEFTVDETHERVVPRRDLAGRVLAFIRGAGEQVRLRAWFGAYDHVALAWLYGPMAQMPDGIPYWTGDVKQDHVRLGEPNLPPQKGGEHDALADARQVRTWDLLLDTVDAARVPDRSPA